MNLSRITYTFNAGGVVAMCDADGVAIPVEDQSRVSAEFSRLEQADIDHESAYVKSFLFERTP